MKGMAEGKAWKFGDNVDTDQIIPAEYLVTPDMKELAKHAFEKARPEFARNVKPGDIIAAGSNFGSGSSREHAPRALIGAGITCVVAKSFARIFFRNSINIGLPLIETDLPVKEGDRIRVDFEKGTVTNLTTKKSARFPPYADFLKGLMDKGGLIPYAKMMIDEERRGKR
jgi:3-isopropylmalate/(R)-2-methylmalate dehydratase small subunit